jgi:hypothetical protein
MCRRLVLRYLFLVLPFTAAAARAQVTHLNVPAKQMVSFQFQKNVGDLAVAGQFSTFFLYRPDGVLLASGGVPAGKALVITDIYATISVPQTSTGYQVRLSVIRKDSANPAVPIDHYEHFSIGPNEAFGEGRINVLGGLAYAGTKHPAVSIATFPSVLDVT